MKYIILRLLFEIDTEKFQKSSNSNFPLLRFKLWIIPVDYYVYIGCISQKATHILLDCLEGWDGHFLFWNFLFFWNRSHFNLKLFQYLL